jgi:hypothetical protein
VTFTDADLVNCDTVKLFEFRAGIPFGKVFFLNLLDNAPADTEVLCHIGNGH